MAWSGSTHRGQQLVAVVAITLLVPSCASAPSPSEPTGSTSASSSPSQTSTSAGFTPVTASGRLDTSLLAGLTGAGIGIAVLGRGSGQGASEALALVRPGGAPARITAWQPISRGEIHYAVGTDRDVTWIESPADTGENPGANDWTIRTVDVRTRQVTTVATAPRLPGYAAPPTVPGDTVPLLHDGRVYWAQAQPGSTDTVPVIAVMSAPVTGGATRLELRDAVFPTPTTHGLYAARTGLLTGQRTGGPFEIVRATRPGVEETVYRSTLATQQALTGLTASATGVAWITQDGFDGPDGVTGSTLWILPSGGTAPRRIDRAGESWGQLVGSDQALAWVDYGGSAAGSEYAMPWTGLEPQALAAAPGLGNVHVTGASLAWAVPAQDRIGHYDCAVAPAGW